MLVDAGSEHAIAGVPMGVALVPIWKKFFQERGGQKDATTAVGHVTPVCHLLEVFGKGADIIGQRGVIFGVNSQHNIGKVHEEGVIVYDHVPFGVRWTMLVHHFEETEVAVEKLIAGVKCA